MLSMLPPPVAEAALPATRSDDLVRQIVDLLPFLGGVPGWLLWPVLMLVAASVIVLFISVFDIFAIWLERKVAGRIQCRLGPMEVGPIRVGTRTYIGGVLQTIADGIKFLGKEDVIPAAVDKPLFIVGPIVVLLGVFAAYVVVPFGRDLIVSDLDLGLFFVAAVGSLEAIGVMMSGWASNNKWSLFGTMRAATQVVSYEIPLSLAFLTAIVCAGTLSMQEIVWRQQGWFWNWFVFANPFTAVAFVMYYIAGLAQCKRAPFDLPEAESEIVAGFHTEYSGMRFAIFFLAEYAAMYLVAAVAAVLFLGGWFTGIGPLDRFIAAGGAAANLLSLVVIVTKSILLVFVMMWLRWTLPRIRLDQVMHLCMKVLLPFGILCLLGSALWEYVLPGHVAWFLGGWRPNLP
jgi:NADH-quinone oxidoreductase subunit H